ncbi:MAG: BtrH N-terminal domain-containing protein, partial [Giesbergeria sp.]
MTTNVTSATTPFQHRHAAHCESGAAANLMTHHGVELSEAMAFGLSSALSFAYLPFVKLTGFPLI